MDSAGSGYGSVAGCFENSGCTAGSGGTASLPRTLFRIIIIITIVSTFVNKAQMMYLNSKPSNLTEMVIDTFLPRKSKNSHNATNVFETNISRKHVNVWVEMRRKAQRSKWLQDSRLQ